MKSQRRYFGKYRGKVENTTDPLQLGRLQVSCPAVLLEGTSSWASPCTPYAGDGVGLFLIPPVGSNIWVEFEGGDPDYPIWSGCFWGTGQVPANPAAENIKMLKTDAVTLTIDDMQSSGGLTLKIDSPAVSNTIDLVCDSDGVLLTIGDAQVKMTIEDILLAFAEDASTRMSADGLELQGAESTAVYNADGIVFTGSDHTITFAQDGVVTDASEVTVSSSKFSVNDGALEVT